MLPRNYNIVADATVGGIVCQHVEDIFCLGDGHIMRYDGDYVTGGRGIRDIGAVERCSVQRRNADVLQVVQRIVQLALQGDRVRKDYRVHSCHSNRFIFIISS